MTERLVEVEAVHEGAAANTVADARDTARTLLDLIGGTGGFGRPMADRLARAAAVTRASGGRTVTPVPPGSATVQAAG